MKRAFVITVLFSFLPLAFLAAEASGGSPCGNSINPPFLATGVKPNILIILDNSNSMDEDFYGNAVGSYSPASKTVVAKEALQNLVIDLQGKANVGIMTYSLPDDIVAMQIHNAMPFASYNPNSYCANPPQACVTYCMNPSDTVAAAACDAGCPPNASKYCFNSTGVSNGQTCSQTSDCTAPYNARCSTLGQTYTSFTGQLFTHNDGTQTNFTDLIITNYAPTTDPNSTRARYCGLAYPKTQMWQYYDQSTGFTTSVYYNQTDPFYDWGDDGTLFGYAGSDSPWGIPYNPAENAGNGYVYCPNKQGTSDSWNGYSGSCAYYMFEPTDSDWALGFYNWGQAMPWYWVGPTWFSWSQGSGNPQGYLHVPVGDLTQHCLNSAGASNGQACSVTADCQTAPYTASCSSPQFNNVYNILNPNANNPAGYMSCPSGAMNTCPYIVNASNTPTAGTLNTAYQYFKGSYPGQSSPITSSCQKNYIIYATDGLPSTFMDGSQPTPDPTVISSLMQQVIGQLTNLNTTGVTLPVGGTTPFSIKTYVLGMGLTTDAKAKLDQMAVAGGTATPAGHAYYADNPTQFVEALDTIITDLLGRVAAGSSISILSEGQTQNGANMMQGVFYPSKYFGTSSVNWPGYLYNYWFYNGATTSNIREDTVHDYILQLNEDYVLSFDFSTTAGLSVDRYWDQAGTGSGSVWIDNVQLDALTPLWEAGKMLFQTSPASRHILTPGSSATGLVSFDTSNATLTTPGSSPLGNPSITPSTFDPCLQASSSNPNWQTLTLQNLINYVRGTDIINNFCSNGTSFNNTPCHSNSDCTTSPYTTCATLNSCRNRTVGLCSSGTAFSNTPCNSNGDCATAPYNTCRQNVWKMGDIVYSTPQVQADYKYCFDGASFSTQLCSQNSDCATGASCQKKQSVVFVGANDGMLHAFQTGVLTNQGLNSSAGQVEALTGIPTSSMGQELWAFIPKNSLPYLRCLAVPPPNSCHLYYNDLSPYITTMNQKSCSNDLSQSCTQNSDCTSPGLCTVNPRTILIGGMRLGGGSISTVSYCLNSAGAAGSQTCSQNSDCTTAPYNSSCSSPNYYVNAPPDTCSNLSSPSYSSPQLLWPNPTQYSPASCTGLSSYYALDITDAQNPILLWEFSHPLLGYSYSGPAVIHKWANPQTLSGDQYYVMFLSGPTKPTDASSIQDVQAFVLTLNANLGIQNMYYKDFGATTENGFGGRLFTPGLDVNGDGYTDFVLFGYGNSQSGNANGWQGGLGKINTNNTDPSLAMDPANWTYDITTYANIATLPITARVTTEQCFNSLYLYAGTGRYFFPQDNYGPSGNAGLNSLMGFPFTCDQYNNNCTSITSLNASNNITTECSNTNINTQALANSLGQGWVNTLDPGYTDATGSYLNERLVTDPTVSSGDVVYFTTSEPTSDPCGYGGHSRVWGLNCATGGQITQSCGTTYTVPAAGQTGTLYLQTSTGAIYQITAASSFTESSTGNRTTQWYTGMPPETAPPVVQSPSSTPPSGQLIQWIER